MQRWALLAAALGSALTAGGCGNDGEGGSGGGIARVDADALVTVITADDAKVLDPHDTQDGGNAKVIRQIYETLVRPDATDVNRLEPALATSWTVADDGLSITFQMRAGVAFHDGAPFDAAAAKLSLDRLRKAEFELSSAPYASEFADVTSYDADGLTLVMHLRAPVARVALRNLSMFCACIVSPTVLEATRGMAADAASSHVTQNASGTGAYRVDAFDPAAKITRLVANESYWRGTPAVKTLIFKPVSDESTRTEYLTKSGGAFVVDDVPRQHWETVEASDAMDLIDWWALNLCYLGVNADHDATRNPVVRQAIQLAIDRAAIVEHYEGTARPTYSIVAQPMAEYDPALRAPGWVDDVAGRQAAGKKLISEAGLEGHQVTVYFPHQPRPYLPRPQDIADTVRQQLRAVGLDARIQGEDKNKLFPGVATGQYELILIGWMTDNGDPDNFYGPLTDGDDSGAAAGNTSRVVNPAVHAKLAAARQLNDAESRVTAYREIERLLQSEVRGYVPLVNTKQAVAVSNRISGFVIDGFGQYRFDEASVTGP